MSTSFHYNGTVTEVDAQSPLRIFVKNFIIKAAGQPCPSSSCDSTSSAHRLKGFAKKPGCMAQPSEAVTSLVYVRLTLQQAWDECGGDDFVIPSARAPTSPTQKI